MRHRSRRNHCHRVNLPSSAFKIRVVYFLLPGDRGIFTAGSRPADGGGISGERRQREIIISIGIYDSGALFADPYYHHCGDKLKEAEMEQIFDIVKQITGVMIVFSVLLHIFSGSPYRRYFQFMEGLLILLLVTAPLFRQWKQEDIVEDCFRKYQKQWETREVEEEMKRIGERRENLINQEGQAVQNEGNVE